MNKRIIFFLLTCSLILLMGHSILPHNHFGEDDVCCRITEAKSLSLLEIIKITLSHDIGDNHLEEYHTGRDLEFSSIGIQSFSVLVDTNELFISCDFSSKKLFLSNVPYVYFQYFNFSLRAPPSSIV